MRAPLAIFLITLLALFLPEADAQTSASNLEVLQTLFEQIATRVDSLVASTHAEKVWLNPSAVEPPTPQRLLYTTLVQKLEREARSLFALTDTSTAENQDGIVIRNRITALEISYRQLRRPGWLRRAPSMRTISVAVDFDVRETQTQRIHFQGLLTAVRRDTLRGEVSQWETSSLPFTVGVRQKTEKQVSWLEPALLTAATGAIVYAFYSLRSQ